MLDLCQDLLGITCNVHLTVNSLFLASNNLDIGYWNTTGFYWLGSTDCANVQKYKIYVLQYMSY